MEQDYLKIKDLDSLKEFSNKYLLETVTFSIDVGHPALVRYVDLATNSFGYTSLGGFFFVNDCMYLISGDEKHKEHHNPDILKYGNTLDLLEAVDVYAVRVIFAGLFTGVADENRQRVYTGDVINAKKIVDPNDGGIRGGIEAGVNVMFNEFAMILDNHYLPLSWIKELEVTGSLFYALKRNDCEVDIRGLCNGFAQSREPETKLQELIKKSPYFPPTTWQEKALEILNS